MNSHLVLLSLPGLAKAMCFRELKQISRQISRRGWLSLLNGKATGNKNQKAALKERHACQLFSTLLVMRVRQALP